MFFHPSPHVDSLVGYAEGESRQDELRELPVVGKEGKRKTKPKVSQVRDLINERDRQDYFTPSRQLFDDYIKSELVKRYKCADMVTKGRATRLEWFDKQLHVLGAGLQSGFYLEIQSPDSSSPPKKVAAKSVVLAMGPAGTPNIPSYLKPLQNIPNKGVGWCHTSVFSQDTEHFAFPPPDVKRKDGKPFKLLVIGGGLVSWLLTCAGFL